MGFVFAWALGAFDAAERIASVGGFIVKTDVGTDAGEAERGFSIELGAGFSLSACIYLVYGLMSSRIGQSAWVQLSLTPEVGARWCGEPFPVTFCALKQSIFKRLAPCVSTMFLHRLWRDMACACNAVPLDIAIFSDDAAITVSNTAVSSLRLAIGTCTDLWTR